MFCWDGSRRKKILFKIKNMCAIFSYTTINFQNDVNPLSFCSSSPNSSTCPPSLFCQTNKSHTTIFFIILHSTHYLHQAPISNVIPNQPIQSEAEPISPTHTIPTRTTPRKKSDPTDLFFHHN